MPLSEDDELRNACTRFLNWHGRSTPADELAAIPTDAEPDRYGEGGVVEELEREVAALLGKPAAVFLPSGTMGQQIALRIHADRRGRRTIVFHPACHVDHSEGRAYERLHGLVGRPAGDPLRLVTLDDLRDVAEPPAALLLELPQRDIGGQLPAWGDLVAQIEWAHERGAAAHLDGARLWECGPAYGRPLDEIAGLFDTVYVSLYKKIGGISGCCVAGAEDVAAEVREWRQRHGGTLFALWPYAASDLAALRMRLPRMEAYHEHALAIGAALRELDGVQVLPDPPQTSMMHLLLDIDQDQLRESAHRLAREDGIWTWSRSWPSPPGHSEVEFDVGDAALGWTPQDVADVVGRLLSQDKASA
jgi:threonine aldolase